ncbi:hypothetical protein [uncultured Pseudodesulfovibrio sp.]|uniref:hypothetical protein n=1 Tax=uncultured Pseudodesulfovibrio sp. TaxID=2035858 RepID=UPI0029C8A75A|nr:hypothetical protein [uncultured Pseudodesulfovibrio sp.]
MIASTRFTLLNAAVMAALLVGFLGCTPKKPAGVVPDSPEAAWQVFRRNYCAPPKQPGLLVKASLYYTRVVPNRRTNRTVVSMWGDFDGPMRLDIAAGVGKLLAHIREDSGGLLVFYPTEKRAYAHVNSVLGATRLGMPFPFTLSELASVIAGDFSGLVPGTYVEAVKEKGRFVYTLHGSLVSRVVLDETGRPILLEGRTTKAYDTARDWRLEINTYEEGANKIAPLPGRLTLSLDNGEKGVLRVKSRELKAKWPAKATNLELPEDIEYYRLDNGFRPAENGGIPVVYEDES